MAYVDRQSGTSRAASIATVGVIHAAIGVALIYGLTLEFVPKPKSGPLVVNNFPIPQPTVEPKPQPSETARPQNHEITAPIPPFTMPDHGPDIMPSPMPLDPLPSPVPQPYPSATPTAAGTPTALFTVKHPRPANSQASWVTNDDYPAREIRNNHQGTVRFRVAVGTNGRVKSCEIVASSGYPALDEATCGRVSSRARFTPGSNSAGVAVVDTFSGSVTWRIPD